MASSSSPGRPGQTGCGGAFLVAFGIVLVFVSIFAATFSDKPATTVQPVKKVSETQRNVRVYTLSCHFIFNSFAGV